MFSINVSGLIYVLYENDSSFEIKGLIHKQNIHNNQASG